MFGSCPDCFRWRSRHGSFLLGIAGALARLSYSWSCFVHAFCHASQGEMKYILKRAIRDWLPRTILNRKDKMGFSVRLAFRAKTGAQGFIGDKLMSSNQNGLYNHKKLKTYWIWRASVWSWISLELWFSLTFIDNQLIRYMEIKTKWSHLNWSAKRSVPGTRIVECHGSITGRCKDYTETNDCSFRPKLGMEMRWSGISNRWNWTYLDEYWRKMLEGCILSASWFCTRSFRRWCGARFSSNG